MRGNKFIVVRSLDRLELPLFVCENYDELCRETGLTPAGAYSLQSKKRPFRYHGKRAMIEIMTDIEEEAAQEKRRKING